MVKPQVTTQRDGHLPAGHPVHTDTPATGLTVTGQGRIYKEGRSYLEKNFPELTRITSCARISDDARSREAVFVEFGVEFVT